MVNTLSTLLYRWDATQDADLEAFFREFLAKRMPELAEYWLREAQSAQVGEAMVFQYSVVSCVGRGENLKTVSSQAKEICGALRDVCAEKLKTPTADVPLLVDASRDKAARFQRAGWTIHQGGRF